jgi:hypothetical protein
MRRAVAVCAVLSLAALSGCTTARYVQKNTDSGIVAVSDSSNVWPTYNRDKAIELIVQHVGPDYEIVKEEETVTGQRTLNNQHVNQVPTRDPVIPFMTTTQTVVTESQTTEDVKAWFIHYRKKGTSLAGATTQRVGPDGLIRVGVDFNTNPPTKTGFDGPPLPSLVSSGQ